LSEALRQVPCSRGTVAVVWAKNHRTPILKIHRASSASINHLKIEHHLQENRPVQKKRRVGDEAMQSYIQGGSNSVNAIQNEQALIFDTATFNTLLYDWVITEGIRFHRIESPTLHASMTYPQQSVKEQLLVVPYCRVGFCRVVSCRIVPYRAVSCRIVPCRDNLVICRKGVYTDYCAKALTTSNCAVCGCILQLTQST
jgi:hypothetical protein